MLLLCFLYVGWSNINWYGGGVGEVDWGFAGGMDAIRKELMCAMAMASRIHAFKKWSKLAISATTSRFLAS